jgi:homoaconitase/3-isopropylmalate dehydratase large subunit
VLVGPFPGKALVVSPSEPHGPSGAPGPLREVFLAGRLEALRAAAGLLRERNVASGLDLCVIPDSQRTLLHAVDEGLVADLLRAGAALWAPGGRPAPPRPGVVRLSSHPGLPATLHASPELAAACAVTGRPTHPELVMRLPRRGAAMA